MNSSELRIAFVLFIVCILLSCNGGSSGTVACRTDSECQITQYCGRSRICRNRCETSVGCDVGEICSAEGRCQAPMTDAGVPPADSTTSCRLPSDCPRGSNCVAGACEFECREDRDCVALGRGRTCDTTLGLCANGLDASTRDSESDGSSADAAEFVPPTHAAGEDHDGDGWSPGYGDCDDSEPQVNPGVAEVPGNGIDDNCNGETDEPVGSGGGCNSRLSTGVPGMTHQVATSFRYPIGSGASQTHCLESSRDASSNDWYVCTEFRTTASCLAGICRSTDRHLGEDWNYSPNDVGQHVSAIANGIVTNVHESASWLRTLIVRHDAPEGQQFVWSDRGTTRRATTVWSHYAHIDFAREWRVSDAVTSGQQLGTISATLCSACTAPHLHFEIIDNCAAVVPGPGYASTDYNRVSPSDFLNTVRLSSLSGPCAGTTNWTCNSIRTARTRCAGGMSQMETCAVTCMVMPMGVDDICATPTSCTGSSIWTCNTARTSRSRCVAGVTQIDLCTGTCLVMPMGTDDTCSGTSACPGGGMCSGHGTCTAGRCTCSMGFGGADCGSCATGYYNYPTCSLCSAATNCNGRGVCSASGACVCTSGYAGATCQHSDAVTCNGHGAAQPDGACSCSVGYAGSNCERCAMGFMGYPTCRRDACTGVTCSDNGTCSGGSCTCNTGYTGVECERCATGYVGYPSCRRDLCTGVTCSGNGMCSGGACVCDVGYSGAECDRCTPGYVGYPTCRRDPCAGVTCSGNGTCSGGSCTCNTGYTGMECERCASGYVGFPTCRRDECLGINCSGNGTCSGGNCSCNTGYTGTNCDRCVSGYTGYPACRLDPCAGVSCSGNGACSGGSCTCNTGYSGASCDRCASGYTGYPSCRPDPCAGISCSGNGSCSGGSCSCNTGYTGSICDRCATGYTGYPSCSRVSEICNNIDDDGNGIIDDPRICWRPVYRFIDRVTGARCWANETFPPSRCSGYSYEIEAFVVSNDPRSGTFRAQQCSRGTDHIIVDIASGDYRALVDAGYDCSYSLGYFFYLGSEPRGMTPFGSACSLWRYRYSTPGGGAHLFTRGADSVTGMICEAPARAAVITNFACFGSSAPGC